MLTNLTYCCFFVLCTLYFVLYYDELHASMSIIKYGFKHPKMWTHIFVIVTNIIYS